MSKLTVIARRPEGRRSNLMRLLRQSLRSFLAMTLLGICNIAASQEWQVVKSQHFLVYYLEDKSFAKKVSSRAEYYYNKIASDLGYPRYDKFWQWENRVKIYIYPTYEQFVLGTGIPRAWATGVAKYDEKEIISFKWNEGFLDALLPHELTHLIFRDFVGFPPSGSGIPIWIDEGVAQMEEESKKEESEEIVKELIAKGAYIPLGTLTRMDVRGEEDYTLARNFYAQAISLIAFLIDKYGGRRFTQFCRELRDGRGLENALSFVYKNGINSLGDLEKKWVEHYGGG